MSTVGLPEGEGLPEGFRWRWTDATVRISLPPIERTSEHAYEPVLSRRDADAIVAAVALRERKRVRAGASRPLARVRLAHDPRYAPETVGGFRTRLSVALVAAGHEIPIDDTLTMSALASESGTASPE